MNFNDAELTQYLNPVGGIHTLSFIPVVSLHFLSPLDKDNTLFLAEKLSYKTPVSQVLQDNAVYKIDSPPYQFA